MNFDLRAFLQALPGDENVVAAFFARLETEGVSAALLADIEVFLQSRVDAGLDALGLPAVNDADPRLEVARKEAIEAGQQALAGLQTAFADAEKQVATFEQSMNQGLDAAHVATLRDGI